MYVVVLVYVYTLLCHYSCICNELPREIRGFQVKGSCCLVDSCGFVSPCHITIGTYHCKLYNRIPRNKVKKNVYKKNIGT